MKKSLAVGATSLLLAGCQTWGPTWTEVTGARFDDMASMTIGPVLINLIDGSSPLQGGPRQPIKVTPGKHTMQLQAVPPDPVMGRIALEEKSYPTAAAELEQANQQDPRVMYLLATALQGKGDTQKAQALATRAADFNALSATYGFVRVKAKVLTASKS